MITVKCGSCKGIKGYTLGAMITDCPTCLGTGTELHDTPAQAVAAQNKRAGRPPKLVVTPKEVVNEHSKAETA